MWRFLGLTLVLVAGATTTANANSRLDISAIGIETALYQSAAVTGKGDRSQRLPGRALQLQVGGALALTQSSLRASLAGSAPRPYLAPHLLTGRQPAAPAPRSGAVRWLDLRDSNTALAYPVTESLSLGLRYSYQRGEDLNFKAAKAGSLDDGYENHKVLLRAQWEF